MQETSRSFHSHSGVASTADKGKWFKEEETSSFCHFCFTVCVKHWKPGLLGEDWCLSAATECSFTLQPTNAFLYLSISLLCPIPVH